jgi:hypothetical protein
MSYPGFVLYRSSCEVQFNTNKYLENKDSIGGNVLKPQRWKKKFDATAVPSLAMERNFLDKYFQ